VPIIYKVKKENANIFEGRKERGEDAKDAKTFLNTVAQRTTENTQRNTKRKQLLMYMDAKGAEKTQRTRRCF
jgi:hypothetical protein